MLITVKPGGNPDKVAAEVRNMIDFGRVGRTGHCVIVDFDDTKDLKGGGAFNEALVRRIREIDHVGDISTTDHEMNKHFCSWRA